MSEATRDRGTARTRRRRAAVLGVALGALALTAGPLGTAWGADGETVVPAQVGTAERVDPEEVLVVVAPGETMWELVLPHAPAGADPHAFVAEVAARNGVDPGRLEPGMALRVPQR